ncbi:hypothetical protein Q4E93_33265 [Flavitalea sp. BT771]|uniref:hypothetical protein n=1 Tax=Flavitalea sp. BT771 TaxID=3063329 RepID=UPI0026E16660|nr:hypothetical protein [Flavitalea sp. BT771]MDO6435532.1 hypothetical protein [Flavitalea sp. BT771]MDV6224432.1 hypothetical protein [Flavitalea sp. BT771]
MQFIKTTARLLIILGMPVFSYAQSTFLPQGSKFEHFLDRMEILQQRDAELNITTDKPISRRSAVRISELADSLYKFYPYDDIYHISKVDRQNLQSLLMNNTEWVTGSKDSFQSKKPWWNTFYKDKANFLQVNEKDFFLVVNPVIQQVQSYETGNKARVFLNSKGLTLRGLIAGKLGFSAYLTDNQERGPAYVMDRVAQFQAVPGAGYYKTFKQTGVDYYDNRASIYFNAWKYVDFQFGYDKNFIGNGYRSLFLSDFTAPYLFLKFNVRIWKLNYQNIYMELVTQHLPGDYQYPKKYATIHHLSVNAAPWLNVGLFENITFSRPDHYEFSYLNPVIFLPAAQQQNGSPDKSTVGLDFKANVGHVTQVYGQLLFNEFVLKEIRHYSNGWWGNKQGLQLGVKYIDAFNVKNLDVRLETNVVRPFTYQHGDSITEYSHYNQPLAHPLGANFAEFLAIVHYQPAYKWTMEGKIIYYKQGLDSAGINFGSNIFESYLTRPRDYGFSIGSGVPAKCLNMSGYVSYEWKENLSFDLSVQYRKYSVDDPTNTYHSTSSTMFSAGVRLNMFRRQYDY